MSAPETETVHLAAGKGDWVPASGDATAALGRLLVEDRKELPDRETFDGIVGASLSIIKQCKRFDGEAGKRTGLVIGYVQSGKTMSMVTVASLARDNGCRLVILLAGVTENLLVQTARKRVRPYLTNQPDARRGWRLHDTVESPELGALRHDLASWVKEWKRTDVPEQRKRPVFLTVMKQHVHLSHLRDLLKAVDMQGIPTLILDDEADQASLDNNASKPTTSEPSTTYERIRAIRAALPNHTYLQYTATPQAPLLISLADMLSPDFAYVLKPGKGYTGGLAFFVERKDLVIEVKSDELFDPSAPPPAPPESLLKAMKEYFIGAAVGYLKGGSGKRSMLVHPSRIQSDHEAFHRFVVNVKSSWHDELRAESADLREGIADEFRAAYDDVARTEPGLPPFEEILEELPYVLSDTRLWKVNSDDGREVDWDAAYSHLLVGGDKLNRGFTVEGLTVTYMPRPPGAWNADTIQQRARFFGYKQKYLGLCRVYLHPDVADAYREYVEHEEDVRRQLKDFEGKPLKEWKRAFLLDHRLKPTRATVLSESVHKPKSEGWFRQNYPHVLRESADRNEASIKKFVDGLKAQGIKFEPIPGDEKHTTARVPLKVLQERLLVEYATFGPDAIDWAAVSLNIANLLRVNEEIEALVVRINNGEERRERKQEPSRKINQLFQGRRGSGEKGDDARRDGSLLTLQLHLLTVKLPDGNTADAPALAVRFPDDFEHEEMMFQKKTGQSA